jgi:hypothetical protein
MSIIRNTVLLALCIFGLAISTAVAEEESFSNRNFDLGVSLGLWFPGNINIYLYSPIDSSVDVDKSSSLLVRAFADAYVARVFAIGAYGNYSKATLSVPGTGVEADATMYEFGISLKPRFLLSPTVALKPGLNVGYRSCEIEGMDISATGLGVNLSVELQIALEGGYIFHIDGGFLSQPVGGDWNADVTWAPIMYLAVGITF